jgi:ELWxxDGT repeat protein
VPGRTIISDRTFESGLHDDAVWSQFWDYNTRRTGWFRNGAFVSYERPEGLPAPQPQPPAAPPASVTIDGSRFYAFDDGIHGTELWVEDATGARLIQDLNPGPESSSPLDLRDVNGRLVFAATTSEFGRELWTLDVNVVPPPPPPPVHVRLSRGVLRVEGTSSADQIRIAIDGDDASRFNVAFNGEASSFGRNLINLLLVKAGGGDDSLVFDHANGPVKLLSKIYGEAGNDTLMGGGTRDRIWGGDGDDLITAGGGHDIVYGQLGRDTLFGEHGHDFLDGGDGADTIYGNAGHDRLFGRAGIDALFGNGGRNTFGPEDGIEEILR